jgi:hypothetical protein
MVLSSDPETMRFPSWENATDITSLSGPLSISLPYELDKSATIPTGNFDLSSPKINILLHPRLVKICVGDFHFSPAASQRSETKYLICQHSAGLETTKMMPESLPIHFVPMCGQISV